MGTVSGPTLDRTAALVYGSETGTAQDFSEEAGRLLERLHFRTTVAQLDAFDPLSLNQFEIVVVVISTTGQGDLPANARLFWKKLLRRKLPTDYLTHVNFTSFGLGDSSYPRFNWAARKLHKRLLQLGAQEIFPRAEADEQHEEGLDAAWIPWSVDLRNRILARYPLDAGVEPISEDVLLQPDWLLSSNSDANRERLVCLTNGDHQASTLNGTEEQNHYDSAQAANSLDHVNELDGDSRKLLVKLKENKRLTPSEHWQDVRHLHLSCASFVDYGPGDVLTIYPQNSSKDVEQMLALMNWSEVADEPVYFTPTNIHQEGHPYQNPPFDKAQGDTSLTLRKLLTHHLDIVAIPRRSFFAMAAHFTKDQMHKERLLEFTDPKYIDELYDYTTRPRRSILEVLQEFDSVKIPWQWAAKVFPELRGRQFSIASGGELTHSSNGTDFDLLVAIVKYKTVIKRLREGVCTRYLADLPIGTMMEVTLQKGGLKVTKSELSRPVLLIGPGTGLAPMRSFIWERYYEQRELSGVIVGHQADITDHPFVGPETILFYGCRNEKADFFYREELDRLREKMPLQIFTAFSRDQKEKIYVQDILLQQSKLVYDLIYLKQGLIYVCGSSGKMPKAVRAAIVTALQSSSDMDEDAANAYLQAMEKEGRYKQETW
ncbi:MAG: hypothetical protein Q9222_007425 [Ikaeria aurantiellina]